MKRDPEHLLDRGFELALARMRQPDREALEYRLLRVLARADDEGKPELGAVGLVQTPECVRLARVETIDAGRGPANLSSALRLAVLDRLRSKLAAAARNGATP